MIGERIREARKDMGLSQEGVGKAMGVSKAAVSKWEGSDNIPKDLHKLSDILNVNLDWLKTGEGSKKKIDGIPVNSLNQTEVIDWSSNNELLDDEVEVPFYKSIELAAGHGSFSDEDYNGFKLRFSKSFLRRKSVQKENIACFPAHGDSMEPVIPNGATVVVDTAKKDINDGDIYAICHGGLCRLKRLYRSPNNIIRIVSYNSIDFPDEYDTATNIIVIGRVFHYSVDLWLYVLQLAY